ncbi:transposase [Lysobacter sp. D1-1-M9]|uniref:transposase n=1 Tax=Novilysobacter TaxID=3382699 RepID=UPI0039832C94
MARQRFTAEFKREAVRLLERGDKPVSPLALELGVPRNRLDKWGDAIAADGDLAFRGSGRRSPQQQELAQLRRQVTRLEQENTILKKRRRRAHPKARSRPWTRRLAEHRTAWSTPSTRCWPREHPPGSAPRNPPGGRRGRQPRQR